MIETQHKHFLIDTSTDLRQQLLRKPFANIDAVLFTHAHADHINGLDELRRFNYLQKKHIPVYGNAGTLARIRNNFDYAFNDDVYTNGVPNLRAQIVGDKFLIDDVEIIPIPLKHGSLEIHGYRIENFAYCTDVSEIPESSFRLLENLDILVLDALREREHPTHFSLSEAIETAKIIGAKMTFFTHMNHNIDHFHHGKILPESCAFAFDGLELELGEVNL
ncbi:MAG: MBL fold metallo-hydrolase [Calditrichaceae bacterium]